MDDAEGAKGIPMSTKNRLASKAIPGVRSEVRPKASPAPVRPVTTPAAPVGIQCRSCGCRHFEVVETSPAYGGRIRRRRECRNCGQRLTTYETPAG